MSISAAATDNASVIDSSGAESLRARYTALAAQLDRNQFQRPLYLDSMESSGNSKGDIYASIDYPFAVVNTALDSPAHWCDVLILHLNTKYCHATTSRNGTVLAVNIGTKHDQALEDAYRVQFNYNLTAATPDYYRVQLDADKGPMSTSNFRISMEAVSINNRQTFIHLTYSFAYGFAGRIAMKAYLATIGSGKVGFTVVGKKQNGQNEYIGGIRGLVERNTMRYYLAIDAYLSAVSAPPAEQLEKRLQTWFSATEQYARQLHEVDRTAYLDMKRNEFLRQQTAQ
ncbi:MAG TPA: hypothetical protein VFW00_10060 [Rhodocyclaceae bacterium]|nr:hypothetical protein [Rhodocyclaceae bacterium]